MRCRQEEGVVVAWVAVWLPVIATLLALLAHVGVLASTRALTEAVADAAALAALQAVDLEALARGDPRLLPGAAEVLARQVAWSGLRANISQGQPARVDVRLWNPPRGMTKTLSPSRLALAYPLAVVDVAVGVALPFMRHGEPLLWVRGQARASVRPAVLSWGVNGQGRRDPNAR